MITEAYPPRSPDQCAVVQVGSPTAASFALTSRRHGLKKILGLGLPSFRPVGLFARRLDAKIVARPSGLGR